jgi:ABC-type phosphate transport system substrate-binding protein
MYRIGLLRTLSAAALTAALSPAFAAPVIINGGGGTSVQPDLAGPDNGSTPVSEFSLFNSTDTKANWGTYWGSGGSTGQQAFINDDLTCDINKVTGANGGACAGPDGGAGNTVDYGTSDAVLTGSQISSWATASFGQTAAGNLIQLPSMGTASAIVVNNPAITSNGALTLSSNDLCGIFSGKITNFDQITDSKTKPTPGAFNVVFRSDGAGQTFLLTSHLAAVCTSKNSAITFTATQTFASLFTTLPGNFIGEKGAEGVADEVAGCNGALPDAFAYISPDFTTVDPNSNVTLGCTINGSDQSPLIAAGLVVGKVSYLPTVANITKGLIHPKAGTGQNLTPPSNAQEGANPALWVPVEPVVTLGYPIVGYTTFDFAQCYKTKAIDTAIALFLKQHYQNASYAKIEGANGYVTLRASNASKFLTTINQNILANANGWNTNFQNATACARLPGR